MRSWDWTKWGGGFQVFFNLSLPVPGKAGGGGRGVLKIKSLILRYLYKAEGIEKIHFGGGIGWT